MRDTLSETEQKIFKSTPRISVAVEVLKPKKNVLLVQYKAHKKSKFYVGIFSLIHTTCLITLVPSYILPSQIKNALCLTNRVEAIYLNIPVLVQFDVSIRTFMTHLNIYYDVS